MVKKYYTSFFLIAFCFVFNKNDVIAEQKTTDYKTSITENTTKTSQPKTIKKKKNVKPKEVDQAETLFSIKGAIKDVGHAAKDSAKKVGNTIKKGAEKAADLGKKSAEKIKEGLQKAFTMTKDFAQKVPWTTVFEKGLKVAIPTFKGCVKSSVVASIPAIMAGPETLGLGTVGTLAGACAIGGAKASIPAILNVSIDIYNTWSNKKKADEIQKQIDLNQQDANAINATISQAKASKVSLKSKDEKEAADVAISKAKDTQTAINSFVTKLKTEQKKYK